MTMGNDLHAQQVSFYFAFLRFLHSAVMMDNLELFRTMVKEIMEIIHVRKKEMALTVI